MGVWRDSLASSESRMGAVKALTNTALMPLRMLPRCIHIV